MEVVDPGNATRDTTPKCHESTATQIPGWPERGAVRVASHGVNGGGPASFQHGRWQTYFDDKQYQTTGHDIPVVCAGLER